MKVVAMRFRAVRLRFPSVRHTSVVLAMIMCATYVLAFFNMRREIYMSFVDPSQTIKGFKFGKHASKVAYDFFLPMIYVTGGLPHETLNDREQEENAVLLKSRPVYIYNHTANAQ